jgi:hypothetical protein
MTETAELLDTARRTVEASERLAVAAERLAAVMGPRSGNVQTVQLPPAPAPQRTERLVLVMCVATAVMGVVAGGATVAAILQGQRLTDMRADSARDIDRLERRQDQHAEWARGEAGILRGYIWTGKVPVANPYPKEAAP